MSIKRSIPIWALICFSLNSAIAQTATSRAVSAAKNFLATLNDKQRQNLMFAFDDAQQRVRWSNLPTTMVHRAGLPMGELSPAQRSAAMALVASVLSKRGFEKVQQIVEGDEVLKANERNNPMFGKDLFYISILERPPKPNRGCCSLAVIIWRSTSRLPANTAFSLRP